MTGKLEKINLLSRLTLGFVFIYHGLIPKIFFLDDIEIAMIEAHNLPLKTEYIAYGAGIIEIILGISILVMRKSILSIYVALTLLIMLLIDSALYMPSILSSAFNPVSINLTCIALCQIILFSKAEQLYNEH